MKPYIVQGGMIGFLLVFGLNTFNGNELGVSLMRACIAAVAFGLMARWLARTMFSELHLSLYLAQQAAAEAAQKAAEEEAAQAAEGEAGAPETPTAE